MHPSIRKNIVRKSRQCDNSLMEIKKPCVVTLTWTLKDSLGETLDELKEPVEFLVGGDDLLPAIETSLEGRRSGATLHLNLEPEHAFGDYDEKRVFLALRSALPEGLEEGMLIEAAALPDGIADEGAPDALYTITEIYPEHIVLDGNHPLAGISLRLHLKVEHVREATVDEVGSGSAGTGFFGLHPTPPASHLLH